MQRYSKQSDGKRSSWMATDDDGEYVKYSDHITQLEAALAAATVPAEVVESANRIHDARKHYLGFTQDSLLVSVFVLSLAAKGKGSA